MKHSDEGEKEWGRRDRLLRSLDRMVDVGRVTEQEAEALRMAGDAEKFNRAVRHIRARHAGVKLDAAVADGSLTQIEADAFLDQLRAGEHGAGLRARLRAIRGQGRHPG